MLEDFNVIGVVISVALATYAFYKSKDYKNLLKKHHKHTH